MDMWAQYVKEREGYETFSTDKGFISYKILNEDCYIRDIFVHIDFRLTREATHLADEVTKIARERGCKYLTGSVIPSMKGSTGSMAGLIKYGFTLNWSKDDYICLIKEI